MLVGLSVSYILLSIINAILAMMLFFNCSQYLVYISALFFANIELTIYHLLIIACHRLIAVYFPLKHTVYLRVSHAKVTLSITYTTTLATLLATLIIILHGVTINQILALIISSVLFLATIVYIICYTLMANKLHCVLFSWKNSCMVLHCQHEFSRPKSSTINTLKIYKLQLQQIF